MSVYLSSTLVGLSIYQSIISLSLHLSSRLSIYLPVHCCPCVHPWGLGWWLRPLRISCRPSRVDPQRCGTTAWSSFCSPQPPEWLLASRLSPRGSTARSRNRERERDGLNLWTLNAWLTARVMWRTCRPRQSERAGQSAVKHYLSTSWSCCPTFPSQRNIKGASITLSYSGQKRVSFKHYWCGHDEMGVLDFEIVVDLGVSCQLFAVESQGPEFPLPVFVLLTAESFNGSHCGRWGGEKMIMCCSFLLTAWFLEYKSNKTLHGR